MNNICGLPLVSQTLAEMRLELSRRKNQEVCMASEVRMQYITDHKDKAAYRRADAEVNKLAKAWDKMIAKLEIWEQQATAVESSCEGFYGD